MKKPLIWLAIIVALIAVTLLIKTNLNKNIESVETDTASISGEVIYRERIALPEGSIVQVHLSDVSLADASAEIIGEYILVTQGENVPIPFNIEYDPSTIQENHAYAVSAYILFDGDLRWASTDYIPVITGDNPTDNIVIMLTGVDSDTGVSQDESDVDVNNANVNNGSASVILNGSTFRLVSFNKAEIGSDQKYTLTFEGNRVSGKFCNSVSGDYSLSNGMIISPTMISTLMFCAVPENLMNIEETFAKLLSEGADLTLEGSTLTLSKNNQEMVFTVFMD